MLKGKTAIVTGSTSGIGLGIAKKLAAQGANLLLNGFGDKAEIGALINSLQSEYGIRADHSPANMKSPEEIEDMVSMAKRMFGSVDVLVNNAGIQFTGSVKDYPTDKWNDIIAINLSACFHAIHAALPHMLAQKYGRIINIASVHGLVASKNKCAYVAAKHGLVGLTKVVALEHANDGITCNAICPGWVKTPLVDKQVADRSKEEGLSEEETIKKMLGEKQASHNFTTVEQLGDVAVFLCSEGTKNMTGITIPVDGGWTAQ